MKSISLQVDKKDVKFSLITQRRVKTEYFTAQKPHITKYLLTKIAEILRFRNLNRNLI